MQRQQQELTELEFEAMSQPRTILIMQRQQQELTELEFEAMSQEPP
jgi:hypothetical protein